MNVALSQNRKTIKWRPLGQRWIRLLFFELPFMAFLLFRERRLQRVRHAARGLRLESNPGRCRKDSSSIPVCVLTERYWDIRNCFLRLTVYSSIDTTPFLQIWSYHHQCPLSDARAAFPAESTVCSSWWSLLRGTLTTPDDARKERSSRGSTPGAVWIHPHCSPPKSSACASLQRNLIWAILSSLFVFVSHRWEFMTTGGRWNGYRPGRWETLGCSCGQSIPFAWHVKTRGRPTLLSTCSFHMRLT